LKLTTSIQQKLAYILNPNTENFDPTFVQATALNPQLVVLLDETQLQCAKSLIEKEVSLAKKVIQQLIKNKCYSFVKESKQRRM
jgi:hypothetical protein